MGTKLRPPGGLVALGLDVVSVSRGTQYYYHSTLPALAYAVRYIPGNRQLFLRPRTCQEKQRAAQARKQRMLEMEVEANRKALKSDLEVRSCITGNCPYTYFPLS